ncbi:hypothetical protein QO034_02610 [Sedimentitalea sp. JM2-8]|uniref:Uncharacterized protein n=1 Tax=Sedimentitalea xiamensis TaxID=3050037 RepID=A0ABT7FA52_9RHOB|nr:hypothetical protein [Sedimentitalea xiamensis]MDK3071992.1 hypothetical protein [Sedimentitalea xiamensis]
MAGYRVDFSATQIDFLVRHLGVTLPEPEGIEATVADLKKLRDTAERRLGETDAIRAVFPVESGSLSSVFQRIADCDDSADPAELRAELTDATLLLRSLTSRVEDLQSLQKAMPVSLTLSAIDWKQASDAVVLQIRDIQSAMEQEIEDPDVGAQIRKLNALADEIATHGDRLSETLRTVLDSPDAAARAKAVGPAQQAAQSCIAFCESNPLLAHISNHPLDGADRADADGHLVRPLRTLLQQLSVNP